MKVSKFTNVKKIQVKGLRGENGKDALPLDENKIIESVLEKLPEIITQKETVVEKIVAKIPKPIDGKDGEKGADGKDAEVDYAKIISEVVPFIPVPENGKDGKDGSPDTSEQIKKKLLERGLEYTDLKNTPDIQQIVFQASKSSKTYSIIELDDVDVSGLTKTNGRYVLGSGGGSSAWGSITGTLSNQADLVAALALKASSASLTPIGSITAWHKSFANTPALSTSWVECNGQVLSDASSVYNSQTLPNLNGASAATPRFLRGALTSGATSGTETHAHTVTGNTGLAGSHSHTFSGTTSNVADHSHTLSSVTLSSDGSHSHSASGSTDSSGDHSHGLGGAYTGSGGDHTHTVSGSASGATDTGYASMSHTTTSVDNTLGGSTVSVLSDTVDSGHTHNISSLTLSGSADSAGSHSHSVTGTTDYTGSHSHSVSFIGTSTEGSHTHTVTASCTDIAGCHNHSY
ncbi:MAG: hypothetical protein M3Q81_05740, partial [bacterium]|nr:hypothetical protein [bacterium]